MGKSQNHRRKKRNNVLSEPLRSRGGIIGLVNRSNVFMHPLSTYFCPNQSHSNTRSYSQHKIYWSQQEGFILTWQILEFLWKGCRCRVWIKLSFPCYCWGNQYIWYPWFSCLCLQLYGPTQNLMSPQSSLSMLSRRNHYVMGTDTRKAIDRYLVILVELLSYTRARKFLSGKLLPEKSYLLSQAIQMNAKVCWKNKNSTGS